MTSNNVVRSESGQGERQGGRRFFIPIGVSSPGEPLPDLPGVSNDLKIMQTIFVDALGYSPVPFVNDPSAEQLRKTLTDWLTTAQLDRDDSVVLYFSGHGHVDSSGHYLYTRGFRKEATADGLKSQALVELILGRKARPGKLWLILDCCHAGGVMTAEMCRSVIVGQSGAFVLAASGSYGQAIDGAFSAAFYEAVRRIGEGSSLDRITAAVNTELARRRRGSPALQLGLSSTEFDFLGSLRPGVLPERAEARHRRLTRAALAAGIVAASVAIGAGAGILRARPGGGGVHPVVVEQKGVPNAALAARAEQPRPFPAAVGGGESTAPAVAAAPARPRAHLLVGAAPQVRSARPKGAAEAIQPGPAPATSDAACVRLLERQSLGEMLSPEENAVLARRCRN